MNTSSDGTLLPRYGREELTARLTGLSRSTRWRLLKEGRIKAKKVGRTQLWDIPSIFDLIESLPDA